VRENVKGEGWVTEGTTKIAKQSDFDRTAAGGDFGPDSTMLSLGEFGVVISRLIGSAMAYSFASSIRSQTNELINQNRSADDATASSERTRAQKRALDMQEVLRAESLPNFANMILDEAVST
jgi:hypothetical protein